MITHDGYFDAKGNRVKDKKTGEDKPAPNPQWLLFEKCMRGDTSDNVFSAYPGVRKKGTKNKVGLLEAFADKHTKGFNWNNLMLQRWLDHNGVEHRVLDDYNRNVTLCDLTAQPGSIRNIINDTVRNVPQKKVTQVGMRLMKFCAQWDLQRILENAKREVIKIHLESKNTLDKDIQKKKETIEKEIEKEISKAQKEIVELKKNSISEIQKISENIAASIIENISGDKLNESSIKATVEDVSKKTIGKYL